MKFKKHIHTCILSSAAAFILAACAGGSVSEPKVPVAIPTAQPIAAPKFTDESANVDTINTNAAKSGKLHEHELEKTGSFGFKFTEKEFVYQTPSGKFYAIGSYTDPIVPDYSSPSYTLKTKHEGQPLSEGGKLFVCCSDSAEFTYAPATKQDYLKFGAWIGANGETDLFVGGKPVGTVKELFPNPDNLKGKGKTTYEVWAVRVRNGQFVTSSYTPKNGEKPTTYSLITANFNTNKLGGTIIGNQDYGADVVMKDVDINGIDFAGTAESDGKAGKVAGKFFGKFDSYYTQDISIGGKVTFEGDKSLDTVFGGVSHNKDRNSTSTDLTPLDK